MIGLTLLIASCFAIGLAYTITISMQEESMVKDFVIYMLIGLLALIFLMPIGKLLLYHIQLIQMGITTNE